MRELQHFKRFLISLIKGLPIIIGCLLIGLFIAKKAIQYSIPKYQSMAKIKLDDRKYGMSGNNLYQDFDVFSSKNKIETEAEILKSPLLIGKTIDALNLTVLVSRVGSIKTTSLFQDNPFVFKYDSLSDKTYNTNYLLAVDGNNFTIKNENEEPITNGVIDQPFLLNNDQITISLNQEILAAKAITTAGNYTFQIKSRDNWINFLSELLDVKAIDKEIPVLRIVVTSEDAVFSANLANQLCDVYVNDYVHTKSIAASQTLSFIDERISDLKTVLTQSENSLEGYKKENNVVNTLQETETGLRDLSKLKLQLINLEMEEETIIELQEYISGGDYYEETAINFGFGDLLLTELVKKLKIYTDEKRDLLIKYTANDQRVINAQSKIDDIEDYVKEAIVQNQRTIQTKREEIEINIANMSDQFEDIPTREKEMRILERDFQINESVYTFLSQKKLEAQIATSALMSFHRLIQPATPSKKPTSPNKVLITFVCGFLGLFGGVLLTFGGKFIRGKILTKSDIEKQTATPVISVLTKQQKKQVSQQEFASLATAIRLQQKKDKQTIVVTSAMKKEGKTYTSKNLAETYFKMGYSVAFVTINVFHAMVKEKTDYTLQALLQKDASLIDQEVEPQKDRITYVGLTHENTDGTITLAHKNMPQVIKALQNKFDYLIIDTPGSVISIAAHCFLKYADLGLYVVRANVSKVQYISNADILQSDCDFSNLKIVLNGAHLTTNYSGNFNSSQFNHSPLPKGFFKKIRHYYLSYTQ